MLVLPVPLAAVSLGTDWDLALADAQFDFRRMAFPLRHAWLTETFNHLILKRFVVAIGAGCILIALIDAARPCLSSPLRRLQLRIVALSAVLVPATIACMKQVSLSHCPWDLQRYGGAEPYIRLFESPLPGMSSGHCMPAGHASSALWMMSFAVLFLPRNPGRAGLVLLLFLALGMLTGWLQQLRGAHFLTHTLWSVWVALAVVFLITVCMDSCRSAHPAA